MKRSDISIEQRMVRWFTLFTLAIAATYSLIILGYSWMVEDNVFNRLVAREAAALQSHYRETGAILTPRAEYLKLYRSWDELPESVYRQHLRKPEQIEFVLNDGSTLHLHPFQLGEQPAILAADISAFEVSPDYLPYVSVYLLAAVILAVVASLLLARNVARRALGPLTDLRDRVALLKQQPLQAGFAERFPDNEIGFLARSIEDSVLHIQAVLQRETDFTRDLSHELRTPVAILKNLASQASLNGREKDTLKTAVESIQHTTETLLALARQESQQMEDIALLTFLEDLLINHYGLSQDPDFELELDIEPSFTARANRNLLTLMCNNLVDNALKHANTRHLRIVATASQLRFENSSNSVPINTPLAPGQRSVESSGLGVGLYLVDRIVQHLGWYLAVEQVPGCFTVILEYKA